MAVFTPRLLTQTCALSSFERQVVYFCKFFWEANSVWLHLLTCRYGTTAQCAQCCGMLISFYVSKCCKMCFWGTACFVYTLFYILPFWMAQCECDHGAQLLKRKLKRFVKKHSLAFGYRTKVGQDLVLAAWILVKPAAIATCHWACVKPPCCLFLICPRHCDILAKFRSELKGEQGSSVTFDDVPFASFSLSCLPLLSSAGSKASEKLHLAPTNGIEERNRKLCVHYF